MNTELMSRVTQTWIDHFHLTAEQVARSGTTLYVNENWDDDSSIVLWPIDQHIVVEVCPSREAAVRHLIDQYPSDDCLTLNDLKQVWPEGKISSLPMYAMDTALFRPAEVSPPYLLRQLSTEDQTAFDVFLSRCSEEDRDEGDVGIDHMIAFGVFDGSRIVCASSVFIWRGFIDIGILTDPEYRGQGLGKAAVSACVAHYLSGDKVVGYRHDAVNQGSQKIGVGLGFSYYADAQILEPTSA